MPQSIHFSYAELIERHSVDQTAGQVSQQKTSLDSLLPAIRNGDQDAAERLVNGLYPTVIRIIRRRIPQQLAEEDVAQDVFLRMFEKLHQFRGQSPIEHWVSRIALHTCLNLLRSQRLQVEVRRADLTEAEERALDHLASPNQYCELAASRDLLERLLESINPKDRLLIELLDLEGRTPAETADLLGVNAVALRVRASRARARLKNSLNRLLSDQPI